MLAALPLLLALFFGAARAQEPITVGAPALAFSLPAINEDAAVAIVRQRTVILGEMVGIQPAHPAAGVVLYFFDRPGGGEGLRPLNNLAKRYKSANLRIIGISTDPDDGAADWIRALKLDFPVLKDNHHIVADRYSVRETPMVVLVDAQGLVFSAGAPAMMEVETVLDSEIKAMLGLLPAP
ncbi:MAG: redoxin domain-containing protein [Pseudomonadota bacterium]